MKCHVVSSLVLPAGVDDIIGDSRVAICLADKALPDTPIVLINQAFCDATGYSAKDALGRNCRFLQPPGGAGPVRFRMRHFLADRSQENARFVIPNISGDGTPFLNVVYMAKIHREGLPELILGSQFRVEQGHLDTLTYEDALNADLLSLTGVLGEENWSIASTAEMLSDTMALIVKYRIEG